MNSWFKWLNLGYFKWLNKSVNLRWINKNKEKIDLDKDG